MRAMRWTNKEVRNLLKLMRRPHLLERQRLAIMLREASGAASARDAIYQVIKNAFDPANSADRTLLESIERCNIRGETTHAAAAAMHQSIRQFFRYRSDAIAAIAESIERTLRHPPDSQSHLLLLAEKIETIDPKAALDIYLRAPFSCGGQLAYNIVRTSVWAGLEVRQDQIDACEGPWRLLALAAVARHFVARGLDERAAEMREELRTELAGCKGPRYDVAAFELAFLDHLDARRRACTAESRALLERMRAHAGQNELLVALSLVIEAEQAMIEGDLTAAAVALHDVELLEVHDRDLNIMARTALAQAMLSHVRGFHQEAYALANGAGPALAALESGFALRAAGIAGRAALFSGAQWSAPRQLCEKYPNVWTRSHTEAVAARHLLATDPQASLDVAEFALALAREHSSPVLAAFAQASLAAALDVLGQAAKAQEMRIVAWEAAARNLDEFARYDMFVIPAAPVHDIGCMKLDADFVAAVNRLAEEVIPAYPLTRANGLQECSTAILRACLEGTVGKARWQAELGPHISSLARALRSRRITVENAQRSAGAAARTIAHAVSACLRPENRQAFNDGFSRVWSETSVALAAKMHGGDDLARAI